MIDELMAMAARRRQERVDAARAALMAMASWRYRAQWCERCGKREATPIRGAVVYRCAHGAAQVMDG